MKLGGKVLGQGMAIYRDPSLGRVLAKEGGEIARELAGARAARRSAVVAARRSRREQARGLGRAAGPRRSQGGRPRDGCTVNDVLMAAAAGALRSYLLERGAEVDGITLRATVPVNLRPLEHAKKLGNHFGLVFLDLPVGEANPMRRLEFVGECMHQLKASRQAIVAFGLLAALGIAPPAVQSIALELFSRKATAVATNVPGPQQPLYMAGCMVREMMFWVPQTGSIGVGISILSYNGRVHFGLIADAKLMPDPDAVIRRFGRSSTSCVPRVDGRTGIAISIRSPPKRC
jgi:diacylglycerol O-acyltransferase